MFIFTHREEDVTVTMYTAAYDREANSASTKTSKVDIVCDAVRQTLEEFDSDRY